MSTNERRGTPNNAGKDSKIMEIKTIMKTDISDSEGRKTEHES